MKHTWECVDLYRKVWGDGFRALKESEMDLMRRGENGRSLHFYIILLLTVCAVCFITVQQREYEEEARAEVMWVKFVIKV